MSYRPIVMVAVTTASWARFLVALIALAMPFWVWYLNGGVRQRRFRRKIQARPDRSPCWRAEFPGDMPAVDRVLTILCDAFMFDEHHKYKFVPEDDVRVIYKNTTGPVSDDFQYEELVMGIEEAFGIDLTEYSWDENFTLGDIVRMVLETKERDRRGPGT